MTLKSKTFILSLIIMAVSALFLTSCAESSEVETRLPARSNVTDAEIGMEVTCPVMGNVVTVTRSTPVIDYKGKRYFFCCPGCDDKFMKNPEKYIGENPERKGNEESHGESGKGEILYWTCSMHPEVKSDVEGNCPICGMNLIPVKESDKKGGDNSYLRLEEREMALAGIKTTPAERKSLHKEIETIGIVAYDPTLVTAQEEYINALELLENISPEEDIPYQRAKKVLEKSEYKLRLLGMSNSEIESLKIKKEAQTSFIIPENQSWVYADVFESDLAWVRIGQNVTVVPAAYPDLEFKGKIKAIKPLLDMKTRSTQVKIRLSSKDKRLLPGMYVDVKIKSEYVSKGGNIRKVIAVPKSAVINTGNRKVVWVYIGEGNFEPREVKTGPLAVGDNDMHKENYYPILHGIEEKEMVVTNGNFLIDSESQITGIAAIGYGGAIGVEEQGHMGH
ncbi:MAG: efflux RND transporter periplasmic adaptor subunit [candidate division WOR-3 bacterium]